MTTSEIVLTTFIILLALGAAVAVWKATTCPAGWRVWFLSKAARLYVAIMLKWDSNRPCPFPKDGPAIIVGNHTSPVDPILIWHRHEDEWAPGELRVIGFMVAAEYVVRPGIIGWVCRSVESIPVKRAGRDMVAVRASLKRLKENKWLGIFPEGHINLTPEEGLNEFNTGAAFVSLKSGVPIYPVFIHNSPRSDSMVRCFFKRSHVHVTYGEPIDLSAIYGDGKLSAEILDAATAHIVAELEQTGADRWFETT